MKVVATRNFSNGMDKSKSKTTGVKRSKRRYEHHLFSRGQEYDVAEPTIHEALHFGWLVPANSKEAEVTVKSVKKADEAKAKRAAEKAADKKAAQDIAAAALKS